MFDLIANTHHVHPKIPKTLVQTRRLETNPNRIRARHHHWPITWPQSRMAFADRNGVYSFDSNVGRARCRHRRYLRRVIAEQFR